MLQLVYDLRGDHKRIAEVQSATLNSDDAGLVPEQGVYGSPEWWRAISDGVIPMQTLLGTIGRVYMSGHNDYPEFEVDDGVSRTQWTREGPDAAYVIGRSVQIEYVLQRFKKPLKATGSNSRCVLRILVDDGGGP